MLPSDDALIRALVLTCRIARFMDLEADLYDIKGIGKGQSNTVPCDIHFICSQTSDINMTQTYLHYIHIIYMCTMTMTFNP